MSVQTQIDRIAGNVSAALTAIADKGVTVPEGSTSDALAELIASIEAGGGLPEGIAAMTSGTYIPASDETTCRISHGFNKPDFFILWSSAEVGLAYYNTVVAITAAIHHDPVKDICVLSLTGGNYASSGYRAEQVSLPTSYVELSGSITIGTKSSAVKFVNGRKYTWIAGVYAS